MYFKFKVLFFLCFLQQILGQRTIDTVQIGTNKYFFSDTTPYSPQLNWFLAYQYCRNVGMDLLSFPSNEEFDQVTIYLENNGKSFNNYWTSGNQLGSSMWIWMTTGLPFNATFNHWEQGGPPLTKSQKGCMQLNNNVWSPANCMDNNPFICQLTRCYYFDYAVTNRINSSQGFTNENDNNNNNGENNRQSNFKTKESLETKSKINPNQDFDQFNPAKLLQNQNSNPSNNFQNQKTRNPFPNTGNQRKVPLTIPNPGNRQKISPLLSDPGNQKVVSPAVLPNSGNQKVVSSVLPNPGNQRSVPHHIPNPGNQQGDPSSISNPLNQKGTSPQPSHTNEIFPKKSIPFLSQEILPPTVGNPTPPLKNPEAEIVNKNLNDMRRLRRKEEFSWAFAKQK